MHQEQMHDSELRDGRRKFVAVGSSAALLQIAVGVVALLAGAGRIPWPSLVVRPAVTVALLVVVARLERTSLLLSAWLGLLAAGYAVGIGNARSLLLAIARGAALIDLAFGAVWLQTSPAIRAYLHRRSVARTSP